MEVDACHAFVQQIRALLERMVPGIPFYRTDYARLARLVAGALLRACRGTRLPATPRTLTPQATG